MNQEDFERIIDTLSVLTEKFNDALDEIALLKRRVEELELLQIANGEYVATATQCESEDMEEDDAGTTVSFT